MATRVYLSKFIKNEEKIPEKAKREAIKRVSITLTVKELDTLIANIAERANQHNALPEIQYTLDSLFRKLAIKYNYNIVTDTPLF